MPFQNDSSLRWLNDGRQDAHLAHAIDLTFADGRTIAFGER
jgi:hypothetical protein